MRFEIYKQGKLIKRGTKTLEPLEFDNELMYAPTCQMVLPIEYLEYLDGREEVKIFVNDKCFWSIVWGIEADKANERVTLELRHAITEWQYRQVSVNHAISNEELNIVYKGAKTEVNEGNDETITANDFALMSKHLKTMTLSDWVERASAQAWVTSNGDKVAIARVDASKVKGKQGTYPVTFYTAKGTSVTVNAEIKTEIEYGREKTKSSKTNDETIGATPFTVYLDEAENLSQTEVINLTKPHAWKYKNKKQEVEVTQKTTNFRAEVGTWTVTVATTKGTSVTVNIKVENESGGGSDEPSIVDKLEDIYNDKNFAYQGWNIEFLDGSENEMIDYVYSKQDKLEALTQTMELTDDLFWRVHFWNEKKVQIGRFGEEKPYIFSTKPSGKTNIRIIEEPIIEYDFENVVNVASVYSDKSDSGMSSLTLREVYERPELQKDGFPVVILHANVNNERDYSRYITQYPKLAPNNELEYAVLDEVSIALESGTLIEGAYAYNDIDPFEIEENEKVIPDDKRIKSSKTVYDATVKKLIQARRGYNITLLTEELPSDLIVGDKVRLMYDNSLWNLDACSNYWKKILSLNDWWYISRLEYAIDNYEVETNRVTLTKWLRIERETSNSR